MRGNDCGTVRPYGMLVLLVMGAAGAADILRADPPALPVAARTELNVETGGAFRRDTGAYLGDGYCLLGYDSDVRRIDTALVCSASDGQVLLNEGGADGTLQTWCSNAAGLYGIAGNSANRLYRSADGRTNWTLVYAGTGTLFYSLFTAGADRLIAFVYDPLYGRMPYYSDDNGASWTRCANSLGGVPVLSGYPYPWNFCRAPHGTIVVSTYAGVGTNDPNQIWRSPDNGATWTKVLELPAGTILHFHSVAYHAGTNVWIQDTGDGLPKRFTYVSLDDGLTWDHWQRDGAGVPKTAFTSQVTRFRDFGHPTRLLLASDHIYRVGWADLTTWDVGSFLDIQTVNATGANFFYDAFPFGGLWYGCSYADGSNGSRTPVILVSADLVNWAICHRFPTGSLRGCIQFAGCVGGKMHFLLRDDQVFGHFCMSPPRVDLRPAVAISPAKINVESAVDSRCESTAGWSVTDGYGRTIPPVLDTANKLVGASSIRVTAANQPNLVCAVWAPPVSVTAGKTYIAHAWSKGTAKEIGIRLAGGGVCWSGLLPAGWSELWSLPYTVTTTRSQIGINLVGRVADGVVDVWLDGMEVIEVPFAGEWGVGGASQAADSLDFTVVLPARWTHCFSARILPSTAEMGWNPLCLCTYRVDAENSAELSYDPAARTFRLTSRDGGAVTASIQTTPRWLHRGALVRCVVRYADGPLRLSVSDGGPVEHVPAALSRVVPDLAGPDRLIRTGNSGGTNPMPHLLAESWLVPACLSDESVASSLAQASFTEAFSATVLADSDYDGDVDPADFAVFQACFNGPNRPLSDVSCATFDFDADADVDLADFTVFQGCFNGPNQPVPTGCS